ncbi:MAG: large-conductance mechanosensitive channel protein MscL [Clostridiaceae bacterium]|jgi:large conductance mechanosensitive channel|nr:large-conductance mechanosensitive channel protein MscL [Clostridiaceae bacterium]
MIKEFKEFIAKGNVLDAAVGFVMGLAFKAIVDSVVNDILMPLIGYFTAGIDFANLKIVLKPASGELEEVAVTYGTLIQNVISFLLVAFFLFLLVRTANRLRRKHEEAAASSEETDADEEEVEKESELDLLKDIRSLLQQKPDADTDKED